MGLGADGCKAQRAANGYSIGKRYNAADAAPRPNPKGRLPAGALRRCGLLVENDYTAQTVPCTASRRQTARGMKPVEIGSCSEAARILALTKPIPQRQTFSPFFAAESYSRAFFVQSLCNRLSGHAISSRFPIETLEQPDPCRCFLPHTGACPPP